jgi:hypothetical protein
VSPCLGEVHSLLNVCFASQAQDDVRQAAGTGQSWEAGANFDVSVRRAGQPSGEIPEADRTLGFEGECAESVAGVVGITESRRGKGLTMPLELIARTIGAGDTERCR